MKKTLNVYGLHAVTALLASDPVGIVNIHMHYGRNTSRSTKHLQSIASEAAVLRIPVTTANQERLDKLSEGQLHQGVVAEYVYKGPRPATQLVPDLKKKNGAWLVLVLDELQDPHNLGACLRSAEAMGVDAVVITQDNSVGLTATVQKVSAGVAVTMPLYRVANLVRTLKQLQREGAWIYGAAGEAEASVQSLDLKGLTVLVMGKESTGLRRLTRDACDQLFQIPMTGSVDSLNVSVATGIALYEAQRQRLNPSS